MFSHDCLNQMNELAKNRKKTACYAGLLYLLMAITAAFSLLQMPSAVVVKNNAAATLANMLAKESLVRMIIFSHLTSHCLFLLLAMTFYRLFKDVNEHWSRLLVLFVVAQVPLVFIGEAFNFVALMIAKGEVLQTLQGSENLAQKADAVVLLLKLRSYSLFTAEVFWGLWLLPLGLLTFRSGFMPRVLGILLLAGGISYLFQQSTSILIANTDTAIVKFLGNVYAGAQSISEISMILWLLIVGTTDKTSTSHE